MDESIKQNVIKMPCCVRCGKEAAFQLNNGDYWCSWCGEGFLPIKTSDTTPIVSENELKRKEREWREWKRKRRVEKNTIRKEMDNYNDIVATVLDVLRETDPTWKLIRKEICWVLEKEEKLHDIGYATDNIYVWHPNIQLSLALDAVGTPSSFHCLYDPDSPNDDFFPIGLDSHPSQVDTTSLSQGELLDTLKKLLRL